MRHTPVRLLRHSPWLLLVLVVAIAAAKAWVCDDAFITLRTADHWKNGLGPRWNAAERTQAYTHPLWLVAVTAATALTREDYATTMVLGLLCTAAAAWLLARRVARGSAGAVAALGLIALSRAAGDYATSGLENPLVHCAVVAFAFALTRAAPRPLVLGAIAGAAACTRLDAALLLLPALGAYAWRARRADAVRAMLAALLPVAAWEAAAAFYYGSWLPNSAVAKLASGFPAAELARRGAGYLASCTAGDAVTSFAIVAGVACAARAARRERGAGGIAALPPSVFLAAGILLHLLWVISVGGDFMRGRFLTASLWMAAVLIARTHWTPRALAACIAAAGVLALLAPGGPLRRFPAQASRLERTIDARGVADERVFYEPLTAWRARRGRTPWPDPGTAVRVAQARQSWAADPFVDLARELSLLPPSDRLPDGAEEAVARGRLRPVVLVPAVGTYGWYAHDTLHVVDLYALGDPLLARLPALDPDPLLLRFAPRLAPMRWRPGHYVRRLPAGYFATLLTGRNALSDPDLASYWDDLALVTRAPLFDGARLRALPRILRGTHDPRLARARARALAGTAL